VHKSFPGVRQVGVEEGKNVKVELFEFLDCSRVICELLEND
jgi:hypothetical protein